MEFALTIWSYTPHLDPSSPMIKNMLQHLNAFLAIQETLRMDTLDIPQCSIGKSSKKSGFPFHQYHVTILKDTSKMIFKDSWPFLGVLMLGQWHRTLRGNFGAKRWSAIGETSQDANVDEFKTFARQARTCDMQIIYLYIYYVYDDDDDEITKLNRQTICKLELIFHNSMAMSVYQRASSDLPRPQ